MPMPIKPQQHFQVFYIAAAFLGLFLIQDYLSTASNGVQVLPYSQFQDMLHGGKLDNLVVDASRIQGTIKAPDKGKPRRGSAPPGRSRRSRSRWRRTMSRSRPAHRRAGSAARSAGSRPWPCSGAPGS